MEMKDRIRQLMEAQNMTQQTFAEYIGMSTATLSNIFNERTKPTLNTVEAIRTKFPNISIDWLMFGNGTMFNAEKVDTVVANNPEGSSNGEQLLNFDENDSVNKMSSPNVKTDDLSVSGVAKGIRQKMNTNIIYEDKSRRCITEIRVFFDDQTYESFVPRK